MTTTNWTSIGRLDEIPKQGARIVLAGKMKIAIFHTVEGEVYAIEDRCPHLGGPLSQGIVHGGQVTCPLHNLVIDLKSGAAVGPDDGCVHTIPVRVDDGVVSLDTTGVAGVRAVAATSQCAGDSKAA